MEQRPTVNTIKHCNAQHRHFPYRECGAMFVDNFDPRETYCAAHRFRMLRDAFRDLHNIDASTFTAIILEEVEWIKAKEVRAGR